MFDPELPHSRIGVRQGETVIGQRMGKASGIEIDAVVVGFGPFQPTLKVFGTDFIAFDFMVGFQIDGVKIEPVMSGQQAVDEVQVLAKFIGCASFAGIIAGDRDAAGEFCIRILESAHVIALPAMEADRDARELFQSLFCIHANSRVAFFGRFVGLDHLWFGDVCRHGDAFYK